MEKEIDLPTCFSKTLNNDEKNNWDEIKTILKTLIEKVKIYIKILV